MDVTKKLCKFREMEVEVKTIQATLSSKPEIIDCLFA